MESSNNQPVPRLTTSDLRDIINNIQKSWQTSNNNSLIPPESQLSPEIQQWIKKTVPTLISLAKTDENFNFPINEGFNDLIRRFLQLPTIRRELISVHPYFIALLRFPAIDASFYHRILDPNYLKINWDATEFVLKRSFIIPEGGEYRNQVKGTPLPTGGRIRPPASIQAQNDMFVQIMNSSNNGNGNMNGQNWPNGPVPPPVAPAVLVPTVNGVQNIQNVANLQNDPNNGSLVKLPLSTQLFSEGIPAHSRLTKFFFPDALPDDLTVDSVEQEMSVEEFKLCFASSCKYYRWGVYRTPNFVYLDCTIGKLHFTPEFPNENLNPGCPAQIKLKVENNRIKMTYLFHHNHSFLKCEKDNVPTLKKDPVRAWLIEQALQGKDWAWVKANKEGINIAGDVEDIDLSKRINRKLYFQICRLLGAETPPDEPDESEESAPESVSPSTTANEQRESGYMFDDETHGLVQNNSYDFPTNDFHHGLSESSPANFDIPDFGQSDVDDEGEGAEIEANNRRALKAECEGILKYVESTMENAFEMLPMQRLHDLKEFMKNTAKQMEQEFLSDHST